MKFSKGEEVKIPTTKGPLIGKVVRYDDTGPQSPFYVVYVPGEYESFKVPAYEVEKAPPKAFRENDESWLDRYNCILSEGSSYHRSPKSKQEKARAAGSEVEEEEPTVRAKRNAKNLPDSFDDKNPGRQRSWKKHRKTQYKVKEQFSFLDFLMEMDCED